MLKITNATKDVNVTISGLVINSAPMVIAPGESVTCERKDLAEGYQNILDIFKDSIKVELVEKPVAKPVVEKADKKADKQPEDKQPEVKQEKK